MLRVVGVLNYPNSKTNFNSSICVLLLKLIVYLISTIVFLQVKNKKNIISRTFKKHFSFYLWDSRARNQHWKQKEWPIRDVLKLGMPNIVKESIFSRKKEFSLKTDSVCFQ